MPYFAQRLAAMFLILVLLVPTAIIALVIRYVDGSPVLFHQRRAGRNMEPFELHKFRTMKNNADGLLRSGSDPVGRLTRTGPFLRKSGLDELPQLLNVARGDMALIGPRAMLPKIAYRVPPEYRRRFEILPGITGLAQVSGRNSLVWSERLKVDLDYTARRSITLDVKIAFRTVFVLFSGSGHSPDRNTNQVDDLGLLGGDDEQ